MGTKHYRPEGMVVDFARTAVVAPGAGQDQSWSGTVIHGS